jgi:hypothetical protein
MSEQYKSPEKISEQEVIEALNTKGLEDPEAKEMLGIYVDKCHAEADAEAASDPEIPEASNRANIKAEIKIATLYSKTEKYKDIARESLEEIYMAASQLESTQDLASEIELLLANLE